MTKIDIIIVKLPKKYGVSDCMCLLLLKDTITQRKGTVETHVDAHRCSHDK